MKNRVNETLRLREQLASLNARKPTPNQADDGDESRYDDKRGTYTKGLQHAVAGPNPWTGNSGLVQDVQGCVVEPNRIRSSSGS